MGQTDGRTADVQQLMRPPKRAS